MLMNFNVVDEIPALNSFHKILSYLLLMGGKGYVTVAPSEVCASRAH